MKFSSTILWQSIPLLVTAAAPDAYIYTHDTRQSSPSKNPTTVSSDTAYSIWARRLGSAERRWLAFAEESTLHDIDLFGGYQAPMFGDLPSAPDPSRLSIVIDGYNEGPINQPSPNLTVRNPTQKFSERLGRANVGRKSIKLDEACVVEFEENQVHVSFAFLLHTEGMTCPKASDLLQRPKNYNERSMQLTRSLINLGNLRWENDCLRKAVMRLDYNQAEQSWTTKADAIRSFMSLVTADLAEMAMAGKQESTVVLLPSHSLLSRTLTSKIHARQSAEGGEGTLSVPFSATNKLNTSTRPLPPPGVYLPACFSSGDACNNATNNCSGHGSCSRKYSSCYACKCGSTVVQQNDDGTTKSVQWGGSACEKKDVSVPFFLFAGFGVAMAGLIAGIIGMVFSMGQEELPSVIGAGVAGPRVTK